MITPASEDYAQTPARSFFRSRQPTPNGADHPPKVMRLQRKNSRSQTRPSRPSQDESTHPLFQPWHVESNPHCNGGLKNAVNSVGDKLKKKLWIGTLGTSTDNLGEALRSDIDKRMMELSSSQPVWIPDAEFESCYDEFCHNVCYCADPHSRFHTDIRDHRFSGRVCTMPSQTPQRRNSSTSQRRTNNMWPSTNALQTPSSPTTRRVTSVSPHTS